MRHNDATGCVTFTQPGYYLLSCPSVFNAHRNSVKSPPQKIGLVVEQIIKLLLPCIIHNVCQLWWEEWIPAFAESTPRIQQHPRGEMTETGGNDRVGDYGSK